MTRSHLELNRSAKDRTSENLTEAIKAALSLPHLITTGAVLATATTLSPLPVFAAGEFPSIVELSTIVSSEGADGFVMFNDFSTTSLYSDDVSIESDLNGDGFDDIVIGNNAPGFQPAFNTLAYVVFGSMDPVTSPFDLSAIVSSPLKQGVALNGTVFGTNVFTDVNAAGDVNGDGFDDIIIGASGYYSELTSRDSYIIFGSDSFFPWSVNLDVLSSNEFVSGMVIDVPLGNNFGAGVSASGVGDFDGDGFDDVAIGAPHAFDTASDENAGRAYLLFGDEELAPSFSLNPLDPGDGSDRIWLDSNVRDQRIGWNVSEAGDLNNDGIDDLVVAGGPVPSFFSDSYAYVVFGDNGSFDPVANLSDVADSNGSRGFALNITPLPSNPSDRGISVDGAGDVNNDGIDDLVIGANLARPHGINRAGQVFVLFGRDTGFSNATDLAALATGDGSEGFVISGSTPNGQIGGSVNMSGDINGDGINDLIFDGGNLNASYVVYGTDDSFPAEILLDQIDTGDGSLGFKIAGIPGANPIAIEVSGGGDVNGDGVDDFAVSTRDLVGNVYLIFGRTEGADDDGDGIENLLDNCSIVANPEQVDTDSDGIGNFCDADFNNDCVVNFADIASFSVNFLSSDALADLNFDGQVNFIDYSILVTYFLEAPGPSGLTSICD